jgi:hypothetical protein
MQSSGGSTELVALRARWRRWTAIVELFANRRRGRGRVDPQAYRALHRELTERCRSLAASADEPARSSYQTLENLVQPWLNPGVFAKADREILDDLLARCRRAERELGERTRGLAARRWCAPALMVSAAVAGLFVCAWGAGRGWPPIPGRVRAWSALIWPVLKRWVGPGRFFLSSIVVSPAAHSIVSRVARS